MLSVPEGSELLPESWMALAPLNQAALFLAIAQGLAMALPPIKGVLAWNPSLLEDEKVIVPVPKARLLPIVTSVLLLRIVLPV